jgi:hypothetical protein
MAGAVGARLTELPMAPPKVRAAIDAHGQKWKNVRRARVSPKPRSQVLTFGSSAIGLAPSWCRSVKSARRSSVLRNRSHSTFTIGGHTSGCRSKNDRISLRSSIAKLHSVAAVASAVRSFPSSTAISPNSSPGVRVASTSACPWTEGALIRTWPLTTAIMWSPGDPLRKMVSPAAKLRIRIRTRAKSAFLSSGLRSRKSQHAPRSRRASSIALWSASNSNEHPTNCAQSRTVRLLPHDSPHRRCTGGHHVRIQDARVL